MFSGSLLDIGTLSPKNCGRGHIWCRFTRVCDGVKKKPEALLRARNSSGTSGKMQNSEERGLAIRLDQMSGRALSRQRSCCAVGIRTDFRNGFSPAAYLQINVACRNQMGEKCRIGMIVREQSFLLSLECLFRRRWQLGSKVRLAL